MAKYGYANRNGNVEKMQIKLCAKHAKRSWVKKKTKMVTGKKQQSNALNNSLPQTRFVPKRLNCIGKRIFPPWFVCLFTDNFSLCAAHFNCSRIKVRFLSRFLFITDINLTLWNDGSTWLSPVPVTEVRLFSTFDFILFFTLLCCARGALC